MESKTNSVLIIATSVITGFLLAEVLFVLMTNTYNLNIPGACASSNKIQSQNKRNLNMSARFRYKHRPEEIVREGLVSMKYEGVIVSIKQGPDYYKPYVDVNPSIQFEYMYSFVIKDKETGNSISFYVNKNDLSLINISNLDHSKKFTLQDLKKGDGVIVTEVVDLKKQRGLDYIKFNIIKK